MTNLKKVKTYETQFELIVKDTLQSIIVFASCTDVQPYFVENLSINLYDENMNELYIKYNKDVFDKIEEKAHEALIDEKFNKDVDEKINQWSRVK